MPEVSVNEVKAMKVAAEAQITQILRQLQDNTGIRVEEVNVSSILGVYSSYPVVHIHMSF